MIIFDLKCRADHVFEAWFASSSAYEEQRAAAQVRCPVCDDSIVTKALMAPSIPTKGNRKPAPPSPAAVKAALAVLATEQAKALASSEWVGTAFTDRARAMYLGDAAQTTIHGQASLAEARALVDDGVPVSPLLLPVIPPGKAN